MEIEPSNANDFNEFVTAMKEILDAEGVANIVSEDPLAGRKEGYTLGLSRFRGYELKVSSPLEVDVEKVLNVFMGHTNTLSFEEALISLRSVEQTVTVDVENVAWALYLHRDVYPLVMELPDQLPIIHVNLCREAAIPPTVH